MANSNKMPKVFTIVHSYRTTKVGKRGAMVVVIPKDFLKVLNIKKKTTFLVFMDRTRDELIYKIQR